MITMGRHIIHMKTIQIAQGIDFPFGEYHMSGPHIPFDSSFASSPLKSACFFVFLTFYYDFLLNQSFIAYFTQAPIRQQFEVPEHFPFLWSKFFQHLRHVDLFFSVLWKSFSCIETKNEFQFVMNLKAVILFRIVCWYKMRNKTKKLKSSVYSFANRPFQF